MYRRKVYKLYVLESALPKDVPQEGYSSPVEAFLNKKIRKKASKIASDSRREEILALARERKIDIVPTTRLRLDQLSEGSPHQGVVARVGTLRLPLAKSLGKLEQQMHTYDIILSNDNTISCTNTDKSKMPLWVVLDRIMDPHNLGAIIRTAHFLGADGVMITRDESAGPTPTVSKTSAGALEILQVCQVGGLVSFLSKSKENGWRILGTGFTQDSLPISELHSQSPQPTLVVLGNEGSGMSPAALEVCHHILHIPGHKSQSAAVEVGSLNVSVAAGIVINSLMNPLRH
ncbi:hypothetical protein DSO57_1017446 [Entomophthora muscae]|nr:hypothetical protein DSO57_1038483 [Entomophthora muscae]KAJ9050110.1 hypothetical protein DSO57_1017446 [Entomophthora muscae]